VVSLLIMSRWSPIIPVVLLVLASCSKTENPPEQSAGHASRAAELSNGHAPKNATEAKKATETSSALPLPKKTHRTHHGEGYSLRLPIDGWEVVETPDAESFHAGALIGIKEPYGCRGAIFATERKQGEKLEAAKERAVASLRLAEMEIVYQSRMLYGRSTAFQYNIRGERTSKTGRVETWRYQGTIQREGRWFIELRAWSKRNFTTARSCHDTLTASFTNMGLGALHENKRGAPGK
jgi:hypothetical protein